MRELASNADGSRAPSKNSGQSDHEKVLAILAEVITLINTFKSKQSETSQGENTIPVPEDVASLNVGKESCAQQGEVSCVPGDGFVPTEADIQAIVPKPSTTVSASPAVRAWAVSHVEIFVPNKYGDDECIKGLQDFWDMVQRGHVGAARYWRVRKRMVKRELLTYPCRCEKSPLPSHAVLKDLGFELNDAWATGYGSILSVAADNNDLAFAQYLIEWGVGVEDVRMGNCSALTNAVDQNNLAMARLLIDTGIQTHDVRSAIYGRMPLKAVDRGSLDMLRLLVLPNGKGYHGLTLNDLRLNGHDILLKCCAKGHLDILNFLFDFGFNTDDVRQCGAFSAAAQAGHKRVCEVLYARGHLTSADVRENEYAALRFALQAKNTDLARWLIKLAKLA